MLEFNAYLNNIDRDFVKNVCINKGTLVQYKRNEYFSQIGDTSSYIGYIVKGAFRYTCINLREKKEYSSCFAFDNEFVTDYPACLYKMQSEVTIQAIATSEIYICEARELQLQYEQNVETLQKARINAEQMLFQIYSKYLDMYRKTPEERYEELLKRCPQILQILTLKEIASYLKVTPTTMSNIRRKITFRG